MTKSHEIRSKATKFQSPGAFRDLLVLIAITALVLFLSYFFNVFFVIVDFLQEHPDRMVYLDEIIMGLLTLSICLAIFAWRRWLELKKEASERIRKKDAQLKDTTTQVEVERIISKQLHSDMDQMKQDVREILSLLAGKLKKSD